jgi:hypothetical protein
VLTTNWGAIHRRPETDVSAIAAAEFIAPTIDVVYFVAQLGSCAFDRSSRNVRGLRDAESVAARSARQERSAENADGAVTAEIHTAMSIVDLMLFNRTGSAAFTSPYAVNMAVMQRKDKFILHVVCGRREIERAPSLPRRRSRWAAILVQLERQGWHPDWKRGALPIPASLPAPISRSMDHAGDGPMCRRGICYYRAEDGRIARQPEARYL